MEIANTIVRFVVFVRMLVTPKGKLMVRPKMKLKVRPGVKVQN